MVFVLALKAVGARPWRRLDRGSCGAGPAIILGQVGKNRAYSVLYSANLRIRRRFGTTSRAGVPGEAERCARALPTERKALSAKEGVGRCGAAPGAGASQSARRLRANRALRHGPRAHHGSRCWASGRQLGRRRILGRLAGGRRGAAWPLLARGTGWLAAEAALPGLRWQTHTNTDALVPNAK